MKICPFAWLFPSNLEIINYIKFMTIAIKKMKMRVDVAPGCKKTLPTFPYWQKKVVIRATLKPIKYHIKKLITYNLLKM